MPASRKSAPQAPQPRETPLPWRESGYHPADVEHLRRDIVRHIVSTLGNDPHRVIPYNYYLGLAYAVRDRLIEQWVGTQRAYYEHHAKRVYYLSLEYLPGKSLMNNLHCLGLMDAAREALHGFGLELEDMAEIEWDAGLGNGGLGRLASCYLDSMATLGVPGYGYGIRYDYGIFLQDIRGGRQVELPDHWTGRGTPWEFQRGRYLFDVRFGGAVREYTDVTGRLRHEWKQKDLVRAMACDLLVPGYQNGNVINMRLWAARSDQEFNLEFFNTGNYIGAVQDRIRDETISKVLYPNEDVSEGRELRLKQQYFFVAATLQDILRRFRKHHDDFGLLPERVAIQLNDTHPAIAIPELMRLLVDEEWVDWDKAWDICRRTFAYTNHTVLPEALETWPVELIGRLLPRHLMILRELDRRFRLKAAKAFPDDPGKVSRMAIISDDAEARVRMAHLAIVGSHTVNGVSALHGEILKEQTFHEFHKLYPGRLTHVTNGVTPRRWLNQANPPLAALLTEALGPGWVTHLDQLDRLAPLADDAAFRKRWREARAVNKRKLADYVQRKLGAVVDPATLYDVHIKRIHEYKRQTLNILHTIATYLHLRDDPSRNDPPRTVFFAGKAAPAYFMAKLTIRLILAVAKTVNADTAVRGRLAVYFLPNYCVSQAERIIPAADLSQQISMAGMEASGTGNMKFGLNGAVTIGTLDGANVEMLEAVGEDNIFIFGHTAKELRELRPGYNPRGCLEAEPDLARALDAVASGRFSPQEPGLFLPLVRSLVDQGDRFFVLADYGAYAARQRDVTAAWLDPERWTRMSILNTAHMGGFSSDRAVREYAERIWQVRYIAGNNGTEPAE
ncbi:MAG: glycogen/starch/alpha-glucan phosphorylase [Desulfovibrionaceae bacterium]